MSDDNNIVFFLMPDGSKVSNDPRWLAENEARAREEALAASPNRGNVGITEDEQRAQIGGGLAPGQSGQPGVGESPTATIEQMVAGQSTGMVMQPRDSDIARQAKATPGKPLVKPPTPVDSNKAVAGVQEAEARRQEAAAKAVAALAEAGEDAGDPDKPYTEWTGKQLKAEALSRNAVRDEGDQLVLKGIKKRDDLAALLQADDDARDA